MNQRIVATETASYDIRIENEVCTAVAPQLRSLENETVIDESATRFTCSKRNAYSY